MYCMCARYVRNVMSWYVMSCHVKCNAVCKCICAYGSNTYVKAVVRDPDAFAGFKRLGMAPAWHHDHPRASGLTLPFPQPRAQRRGSIISRSLALAPVRGTEFALGRCSSKPLRRRAVARRRISRWRTWAQWPGPRIKKPSQYDLSQKGWGYPKEIYTAELSAIRSKPKGGGDPKHKYT